MADLYDDISGAIETERFERVRYRIGWLSGDVFDEDDDYDGMILQIEITTANDGLAMIEKIRKE